MTEAERGQFRFLSEPSLRTGSAEGYQTGREENSRVETQVYSELIQLEVGKEDSTGPQPGGTHGVKGNPVRPLTCKRGDV